MNSSMQLRAKPVSFLRIKAQYENVGDALIIRELVTSVGQHSEIVADVRDVPDFFVRDVFGRTDPANVTFITERPLSQLVTQAVRGAMAKRQMRFFFLPSGILGNKGRKFYWRSIREFFIYGLLRRLGVRFFHFGASYSKIGPRHAKLIGKRIALLEAHLVRDAATAQYLKSLRLRCDGLIPDFSFGLYRDDQITREGHAISFSFRVDRERGDAERLKKWIEDIVGTLTSDVPLKFVSQVRRDDAFMTELFDTYKTTHSASLIKSDSIALSLEAYRGVERLYSNRLHSLLMAAYCGTKPIAIVEPTKDSKIIGIFQDLGASQNIVVEAADLIRNFGTLDTQKCKNFHKEIEEKIAAVFAIWR